MDDASAARTTRHPFAAGWFLLGVAFFAAGIVASVAVIDTGPLVQMKVLGAATLAIATLGAAVCLVGVRLYDAPRWRRPGRELASLAASLRGAHDALVVPRQVAYVRAVPRVEPRLSGRNG